MAIPEPGKEEIRRRFSRAAASYDAHAVIQKELAGRLLAGLPGSLAGDILEIGCGTGRLTACLAARYPEAGITALDFAEGMIRQARARLAGHPRVKLLCADGESFLAASRESFALICANATLQWFSDPGAALREISRLLAEGGCFAASLFGPASFCELAHGLSLVFGREVSLPAQAFPGQEELAGMMAAAFPRFSVGEEVMTRDYPSLAGFLEHIRKTGTGGGRLPGLLTRERLKRLDAWFLAEHGGYPATCQAFIVRGEK